MIKKVFAGKKVNRFGFVFIAPFFIALSTFSIYPMLYTFYLSFHRDHGEIKPPPFIGLKNFVALLHDPLFFKSISNTFILWIVCFIPQMILAITLAVILTDKSLNLKGKKIFRGIYFLPNIVTLASVTILFYFFIGTFNKILVNLHILSKPYDWLGNPLFARLSVSFVQCWTLFGVSMIIFMAGINAIPNEIFEAARVDGVNNRWQNLRYIILPSIKGSIIYNVVTSIIGGLAMFDVPFLLTHGANGTDTTATYMYTMSFLNWDFGYGATIYVGLFLITAVVTTIAYSFISRKFSKD